MTRSRLQRIDDRVLGAPGTARAWYADLVLGLHPWLAPVFALAALVGVGLVVAGAVRREVGLAVVGLVWLVAGASYAQVGRGKRRTPGSRGSSP